MRRLLLAIAVVVLLGGGGFLWWHGHSRPASAADPPYIAKQAVLITEGPVTSNLAGPVHYIQLTVSFGVMPAALAQVGGKPPSPGGSGTGNPTLDAHLLAAITLLCRQTSYASLQTTAGLRAFANRLHRAIAAQFPPSSVGPVLLTNLVTQ